MGSELEEVLSDINIAEFERQQNPDDLYVEFKYYVVNNNYEKVVGEYR